MIGSFLRASVGDAGVMVVTLFFGRILYEFEICKGARLRLILIPVFLVFFPFRFCPFPALHLPSI